MGGGSPKWTRMSRSIKRRPPCCRGEFSYWQAGGRPSTQRPSPNVLVYDYPNYTIPSRYPTPHYTLFPGYPTQPGCTPTLKGHETSCLEGTWDQTYLNLPSPWTDRHLWKHNLPLRSVMMLQWLSQTLGCKWNLLMKLSEINIQGRCHLKCKTGEWLILEKSYKCWSRMENCDKISFFIHEKRKDTQKMSYEIAHHWLDQVRNQT